MDIKRLGLTISVAVATLVAATSAAAYSVTVGGTVVVGEGLTSSVAGAVVTNFNSSLANPAGYSGGAVKNGSSVGNWASPPGDTSNFYTVGPGAGQSSPGVVSLGTLASYFGYFGGSPDTYNTLELWRDNTKLTTFTGTQLASFASVNPNGDWGTGAYWNIWATNSSEFFNTIKFISSSNAFETDNHAVVSAVPLPAAAWLFGSAVLGFVSLSNRRKV